MKYAKIILISVIAFILAGILPGQILAQNGRVAEEDLNQERLEQMRILIQEKRQELQEQFPFERTELQNLPLFFSGESEEFRIRFEEEREKFKDFLQGLREDLSGISGLKEKRAEIRARQQQFLEEHRRQIKEYREEMQNKIEDIKIQKRAEIITHKEALRKKMQELALSDKADMAEQFSEKINTLNDVLSDRYMGRLSAFEIVLDKMELRAQKLELGGKDIAEVLSSISAARQVIVDARKLILEQKEKVYKMEIVTGQAPGQAFRATLKEMKDDHMTFRESVMKPILEALKTSLNILKETRLQPSQTDDGADDDSENNNEDGDGDGNNDNENDNENNDNTNE